jgi:hypothetical protein
MVPHKTKRGAAALERLKVFEGVPPPFDKVKRLVVPDALQVLRLQHGHRFCKLGQLAQSVSTQLRWGAGVLKGGRGICIGQLWQSAVGQWVHAGADNRVYGLALGQAACNGGRQARGHVYRHRMHDGVTQPWLYCSHKCKQLGLYGVVQGKLCRWLPPASAALRMRFVYGVWALSSSTRLPPVQTSSPIAAGPSG